MTVMYHLCHTCIYLVTCCTGSAYSAGHCQQQVSTALQVGIRLLLLLLLLVSDKPQLSVVWLCSLGIIEVSFGLASHAYDL